MVSKSTKKLLLIGGGVAVLGYLLLRKGEEAVTGIAAPFAGVPAAIAGIPTGIQQAFADIPTGVQAGAAALTGGIVETIGAAGTGLVGGAAEAIAGGIEEISRPFPQPLRTYEPVPEVRPVLQEATVQLPGLPILVTPQRAAYQELIGVPIVTPEQYEAIQQPVQPVAPTVQPVSYQVGGQPTEGQYWINPLTQGALAPFVLGQTPASVLALREQGIFPAVRRF